MPGALAAEPHVVVWYQPSHLMFVAVVCSPSPLNVVTILGCSCGLSCPSESDCQNANDDKAIGGSQVEAGDEYRSWVCSCYPSANLSQSIDCCEKYVCTIVLGAMPENHTQTATSRVPVCFCSCCEQVLDDFLLHGHRFTHGRPRMALSLGAVCVGYRPAIN